jgi:long-chain acyl-CoA synthetase
MAETGQVMSYRELASAAQRGARVFRELGLETGDGIVLLAENCPEFLPIYWAAQLAGLYFTPISVQFQRDEIAGILNDCDAQVLIVSEAQAGKIAQAPQAHQLSLSDWHSLTRAASDRLIDDACEGAEMLYSSGTTGQPKGVRHAAPGAPLGTTSELLRRRLELHQVDESMVYLSTAPLYHSAPLRYNAMAQRVGATSVIMPKFTPGTALELIERHRVTHSQWVPTMFVRLLQLESEQRARWDLSSHRFAIHAAAPCPVEVKRAMLDWWGPILYEYYSGTEGNGQTAIDPQQWLAHPGSVGQSLLGELHMVDAAGNELPTGQEGLVYFEGGPAFEYYKDPEKTAGSRNPQGWSTLGDNGHLDNDGYLYLTDRSSYMIISGGVNIYPREVEDLLQRHPAVADVAVFGIPDAEFSEEVKAAVELRAGLVADDVRARELIDHCRKHLAHLKCPKSIDFHDALPRHATGKLYKRQLRDPYWT